MSTEDPNPTGRCLCGCGETTAVSSCSNAKRGEVRGCHRRFVKGHNARKATPYVVEDRGYDTPCWVWQLFVTKDGHGSHASPGRPRPAHVVYYERVHGPVEPGHHVHHKCKQPPCVNPDHLESVTPAEHKHRHSALSWDVVRDLRERHAAGARNTDLARMFGVSPATVCDIAFHRTWREAA